MHGYFIAGTDTGVGKTRITAGLAAGFRALGRSVAAAKPVSTGALPGDSGMMSADLNLIASFSGQKPHDRRAFLYCFDPPVSPHIAAHRAGICIDIARITELTRKLGSEVDFTLVEGTGGWLTPLDEVATMADLARALGLPVILVVGVRLGCLNHALLTARAIGDAGLPLAGWIGNILEPGMLERQANLETLGRRLHSEPLAVVPCDESITAALEPLRGAAQRLLSLGSRQSWHRPSS